VIGCGVQELPAIDGATGKIGHVRVADNAGGHDQGPAAVIAGAGVQLPIRSCILDPVDGGTGFDWGIKALRIVGKIVGVGGARHEQRQRAGQGAARQGGEMAPGM